MTQETSTGPLAGIRVVHLASIGPGPYAAMLLADLGGEVTVVDRTVPMAVSVPQERDPRRRGQESIALNLKADAGRALLMEMIEEADVLIEGMRPGAAERLGVGPRECLERNPRLIFARITGWGQDGPLAQSAGHDINYVGLTGALHAMGVPPEPPPVPLNLLGDYAGGGAFAVIAILAALQERGRTGRGQVLDTAMVDGVASLTAATMGMLAVGGWGPRGSNVLDGGAPWYRTYRTRDGRFVAVGAIEPAFYAELLAGLGLDAGDIDREDRSRWPELAERIAGVFAGEDCDHWERVFAGKDACVTPVLTFEEAAAHPHNVARRGYVNIAGVVQPAPAPRFGAAVPAEPAGIGRDTDAVLARLGRSRHEIAALRADGVVA